jgi:hypothetical protein
MNSHKNPIEKDTASAKDMLQFSVYNILHDQRGYSMKEANELIRFAEAQASGKNVKLEPNNPLHRRIRDEDLKAVKDFFVSKSHDAAALAELDIKGPRMALAAASPTRTAKEEEVVQAPVQGFAYKVIVSGKEYNVSMKPSGISAPVSGKENERKEQMSKVLSEGSLVTNVTERNVVSGADVAINTDAFLSVFLKAMSENPDGVKVYPPRRV